MGCCCPKQKKEDDSDETARLLGSESNQIKSRFVDQSNQLSGAGTLQQQYLQQNGQYSRTNPNYIDINSPDSPSGYQQQQQFNDQMAQQQSEGNQIFEKILSEIIPVISTTIDQRATSGGPNGVNTNMTTDIINTNQFVQDMPFKMKGLLEPQKNQLQLPEGVTAPVSVLAAQPPFMNDIHLINTLASEANKCINDYTIQVPDNVAFNFNPIV